MSLNSVDELRAFVAVMESGGFTAAAKRLEVSTNAVSLRLQRLEEALGVRLLIRTTRVVTPTDEGRRFHERVSKLLLELEAAEAEVRPTPRGMRGTVRIGLPGAIASEAFHQRLRLFMEANPELSVHLRVADMTISPASEGLDFALHVGEVADTGYVARLIGRPSWVLAASPWYLDRHGRPETPADLSGHSCLRFFSRPPQDTWTLFHVPAATRHSANSASYSPGSTYFQMEPL